MAGYRRNDTLTILASRVSSMMRVLRKNRDLRFYELDKMLGNREISKGNYRGVFEHVEGMHPDLYNIIQTCR